MTFNYQDSVLPDYDESNPILSTPKNLTPVSTPDIDDGFDTYRYTELWLDTPSSSVVDPLPSSHTTVQSLENPDDIPFDANEWLIIDSHTGKTRPPKQDEFLRLLIENSRYSSYGSWLDKSQGLFKIHQPTQVAALWTKVKCRQTTGDMDYDTFARGVRYHYQTGTMIKTKKKYTFRFTKSTDNTEQ
jgi:hypothetical protein